MSTAAKKEKRNTRRKLVTTTMNQSQCACCIMEMVCFQFNIHSFDFQFLIWLKKVERLPKRRKKSRELKKNECFVMKMVRFHFLFQFTSSKIKNWIVLVHIFDKKKVDMNWRSNKHQRFPILSLAPIAGDLIYYFYFNFIIY